MAVLAHTANRGGMYEVARPESLRPNDLPLGIGCGKLKDVVRLRRLWRRPASTDAG